MNRLWKLSLLVGALALMATPALAFSGSDNPGTSHRTANQPSPPSQRALGVVCAQQNASRSNENDPAPGTPFSRCVKSLAQAVKTACQGESKSNANDPDAGTPFSRCVRALVRGLRSSKARNAETARGTAKVGCSRPAFDSGREFSRCVRVVARTLRRASS
jgi:hypothetical protein